MPQSLQIKRELFSILSWRAEARAATMPSDRAQRVRDRIGHLLRWTRAHDSLPEIANRAAILCFHGVIAHDGDRDVECEHLHITRFRQLLRVLDRSFQVISLTELVDCIRHRRSPPPKSVVLTFDDGYANNAEVAAEELDRRRMPWSAFLPAQLIETGAYQWIDDVRLLVHRGGLDSIQLPSDDGPISLDLTTRTLRHEAVRRIHEHCRYVPDDVRHERLAGLYAAIAADRMEELRSRFRSFAPMTWDQARRLQSAGVDVGSHSLTHTALGPQTAETIAKEVFAARELLQSRIGDHSPHFSYPYGRLASLSEETDSALAHAGYNCALTLEQDVVRCDEVNLLRLPRLIVSPHIGRMVFSLWQRFLR